jgi:hypothetical protein
MGPFSAKASTGVAPSMFCAGAVSRCSTACCEASITGVSAADAIAPWAVQITMPAGNAAEGKIASLNDPKLRRFMASACGIAATKSGRSAGDGRQGSINANTRTMPGF